MVKAGIIKNYNHGLSRDTLAVYGLEKVVGRFRIEAVFLLEDEPAILGAYTPEDPNFPPGRGMEEDRIFLGPRKP